MEKVARDLETERLMHIAAPDLQKACPYRVPAWADDTGHYRL